MFSKGLRRHLWRPTKPSCHTVFALDNNVFMYRLDTINRLDTAAFKWQASVLRRWKKHHGFGRATRSYSSGSAACSTFEHVENRDDIGHNHQHESSVVAAAPKSIILKEADYTQTIVMGKLVATQITPTSVVSTTPKFWSHQQHKAPDGKDLIVHYCKSLKSSEKVAKYFLDDEVIGFDMEWKAQSHRAASIQNNVSLIQIANKTRIALFQIALFKPAKKIEDFVAPSLRKILESPDITKVGVSIKADCTRLRKYLGIDTRSIFELSHLYKLVKYHQSSPNLINKRTVNLSEQVEEHLGLPLEKDDEVRCSDWTTALNYRQVQYAASDPYACLCLFNAMDAKRKALVPMPPRPAHAELDLPIRIVHAPDVEVNVESNEEVVELTESPEISNEDSSNDSTQR